MQAYPASPKEILARLVSFDTTSEKTNIPMAEWVRGYLQSHGIDSHYLPADDGIHANLFATIGPSDGAGIALSGHMDVVPVTGQPWDTDPFTLAEKDGRLYGRGTCDMKGYVACVLAMVPEFKQRNLKTPLHIALSYNEEVGCIGVVPMIDVFGKTLPKPHIVLIGEPTSMTVVDAHKGGYRFLTEITGKDAHSSKPQLGANAIMAAGELMGELKRIESRLKERVSSPRFDPPYSSISVTNIEGGIASNIIPPKCSMRWGVRCLPGVTVEDVKSQIDAFAEAHVLPAMRAVFPDCAIETKAVGILPPFFAGENSEATSLALKLAGQNETFAVSYGTEASRFQDGGCASVICGPGSIDQAHQPNEYIEISEIEKCMGYLRKLADWAEA